MIVITAGLAVVLFVLAFWRFGVVAAASRVVAVARRVSRVMRDPELNDADRERASRQASVQMLTGLAAIVLRASGALLVSLLPPALADVAGIVAFEASMAVLARSDVLVGLSVAMVVVWLVLARAQNRSG